MQAFNKSIIFLFIFVLVSSAFISKQNSQLFPTRLSITVLNNLGHREDSVKVMLYLSEEDLRNGENLVQEPQYTDDKGRVKFTDLEPQAYFIEAVKGKMNNYGGAQVTPELTKGKTNRVNIIIE